MSGDARTALKEQPVIFYSEHMTETKEVLIRMHMEEETVIIKPWRTGSLLQG